VELIYFKPGTELTFKTVLSIRAKLYKEIIDNRCDKFGLDLSDVIHCDSAGLALLIEARKLCKRYNKVFEVIGMSLETQSLAEFCGVKSILETT
jgi:phospholipid transport system transporter-binding protein